MTDNEQIRFLAESEDNKPLFFLGVLGIVNNQSFLIVEYGLGFFKRDVMLFLVDGVFVLIPLKSDRFYNYIIIMRSLFVKMDFRFPEFHTLCCLPKNRNTPSQAKPEMTCLFVYADASGF